MADRLDKTADGCTVQERDIAEAKRDMDHALADIERGENELRAADAELEKAEAGECLEVEVTVDRVIKRVDAGTYVVAAFKSLIGIPADRELDVLKDGTLVPLPDERTIEIHAGEVFVSHARTGGSS